MFPCRNIACQSYGKRFVEHLWCDFLWDQSAVTFWSMSYDQYFWYIFFMRMKGLIVILLLGTVFGRRIVTRVFLALFLFLTGIFITMSVIERGLSGIAAVLLAMLPQWIFYLLAFTVYERGRERKVIFVCALLVVLGLSLIHI